MTEYSKLSDDEINDLVSDAMGIPRGDKWCSDWEITSQIIIENRIGLLWWGDYNEWVATKGYFGFDDYQFEESEYDKNPLRAVLILFLTMKDSENEGVDK